MNKTILMGRLTKDPEKRTTNNGTAVTTFTIAVDRNKQETDFIACVAWKDTAELICKYFRKGQRMLLDGSIQGRKYLDNNGQNKYVTEVVVNRVEFVEKREERNDNPQYEAVEAGYNDLNEDDPDTPF